MILIKVEMMKENEECLTMGKKITLADMRNFFPDNKGPVEGEEFITWSYDNALTCHFKVVSLIDDTLITSANAVKNEIVLRSGDVICGLAFRIYPLTRSNDFKGYYIQSTPDTKSDVRVEYPDNREL